MQEGVQGRGFQQHSMVEILWPIKIPDTDTLVPLSLLLPLLEVVFSAKPALEPDGTREWQAHSQDLSTGLRAGRRLLTDGGTVNWTQPCPLMIT